MHDRNVGRWMPHVTLLYPFVPADRFDAAEALIATACAAVKRFEARVAAFRFFDHASGSATVWLVPEPRDEFVRLQSTLQRCLPEHDDVLRHVDGFTPHLSVGQARSSSAARALIADLQTDWRPMTFTVDSVALIRREGDRPFQVDRRVALA